MDRNDVNDYPYFEDTHSADYREEPPRQAASRRAAAKEAARKAARDEKYEDEQRALNLELKRLEVRKAQSQVKVQEAVDNRKVERADELVDVYIQNQRPAAQQ